MQEKTEWHPDIYSGNSDFQYEEAMAIINEHKFNGDEKILDIGCGDGRITNYLAMLVPNGYVIGIDNSSKMIAHAQENYKQDNLVFKEMSAEDIAFQGEFDIVFSSFCLHWVSNKQKVFDLIHNSLKPQGILLCVAVVRNEVMAQARSEILFSSSWKQYFYQYKDPSENSIVNNYFDFSEKANLQINTHHLKTRVLEFETRKRMSDFMRNVTLCLSRLPSQELKDLFMEEYVKRYLELCKDSTKDNFRISFNFVELKAQKPQIGCEKKWEDTKFNYFRSKSEEEKETEQKCIEQKEILRAKL